MRWGYWRINVERGEFYLVKPSPINVAERETNAEKVSKNKSNNSLTKLVNNEIRIMRRGGGGVKY